MPKMRFDYQDDSDEFESSKYGTEKIKPKNKKVLKESDDYGKKTVKKTKRF